MSEQPTGDERHLERENKENMTTKLLEFLERYTKQFSEGFPTYQLARTRDENEVIKIIQECLKEGKTVYDMGYLDEESENIY